MKYTCPVCGYDKMTQPPANYYICPCCGTEFGLDDFDVTHAELRERWLAGGAKWFSEATPPYLGWSPYQQLWRAGLGYGKSAQATQSTIKNVGLASIQFVISAGSSAASTIVPSTFGQARLAAA